MAATASQLGNQFFVHCVHLALYLNSTTFCPVSISSSSSSSLPNIMSRPFSCYAQSNSVQCDAMQCDAMQCNAMQCSAMRCNAMQCEAPRLDTGDCAGRERRSHQGRGVGSRREHTVTSPLFQPECLLVGLMLSSATVNELPLLLWLAVQAIEFVQMQRDDELWELLISLALESPALTGGGSFPPPACLAHPCLACSI